VESPFCASSGTSDANEPTDSIDDCECSERDDGEAARDGGAACRAEIDACKDPGRDPAFLRAATDGDVDELLLSELSLPSLPLLEDSADPSHNGV
jgi:hypothetical protein